MMEVLAPLAGAGLAFVGVSFFVLLRRDRAVGLALSATATLLVLIPPSAYSGLPGGQSAQAAIVLIVLSMSLIGRLAAIRIGLDIVAIATITAVQIAGSAAHGYPLAYYTFSPVVGFLFYVAARNSSRAELSRVINTIVVLAVLEVPLAAIEVVVQAPLIGVKSGSSGENPFLPFWDRAQGTLGHPLVLSGLLLAALTWVIVSKQHTKKSRTLISITLGVGLLLSGSSTALILGVLVVTWSLLFQARPERWLAAGVTLGAIALVGSFVSIVPDALGNDLSGFGTAHRISSIEAMPRLILDRGFWEAWFGNGANSTAALFADGRFFSGSFLAVDNQYVLLLAQAGLVGLLLFVAVLIYATVMSVRRLGPLIPMFTLLGLSFDFLQWYATSAVFFIALADALHSERRDEKGHEPKSGTSRGFVLKS